MSYGIAAVKNRTSQTFLNFYDVYSVVDQKSLASSQRSYGPSVQPNVVGDGSFTLSIEAQKNID